MRPTICRIGRLRAIGIARTFGAALLLAGVASPALAQQPSLIGTWEWTRKSNNCVEQFVFRGDGTVAIASGDERIERSYSIAWSPEPNGRYKLTMNTVKDSGGAGCADSAAGNTARQDVVYVLFGKSQETMIVCNSIGGADCIGPLKKTAG